MEKKKEKDFKKKQQQKKKKKKKDFDKMQPTMFIVMMTAEVVQ